MLDAILDLFDRRRKDGDARRSGGGVLDRLGGLVEGDDDDRDRRPYPDRRADGRSGDDRWLDDDDDDDDRGGRRRPGRRGDGDGFDFG